MTNDLLQSLSRPTEPLKPHLLFRWLPCTCDVPLPLTQNKVLHNLSSFLSSSNAVAKRFTGYGKLEEGGFDAVIWWLSNLASVVVGEESTFSGDSIMPAPGFAKPVVL